MRMVGMMFAAAVVGVAAQPAAAGWQRSDTADGYYCQDSDLDATYASFLTPAGSVTLYPVEQDDYAFKVKLGIALEAPGPTVANASFEWPEDETYFAQTSTIRVSIDGRAVAAQAPGAAPRPADGVFAAWDPANAATFATALGRGALLKVEFLDARRKPVATRTFDLAKASRAAAALWGARDGC
jgi:hypothetical protein